MDPLRIFVSHSHADNAFCDVLVTGLRGAGADVWYDEHDLGTGELLKKIPQELVNRPVFIVILSQAAFRSSWVGRECQWAYKLQMREPSRVILPVTAQAFEANDFNTLLFLDDFKRIEDTDFRPLSQSGAVAKTLQTLALTPQNPSIAPEISSKKTTRENVTPTVLWVDDTPSNNVFERRTLERLGIQFTISTSTDDALGKLVRNTSGYDAIISDMGRPPDSRAGYTLLGEVRRLGIEIPFIIYASSDAPHHKAEAQARGAYGSTGISETLFQLVTDALEL